MTYLTSSSTLSVSEFAALVDASTSNAGFAPLSPCPRSASPELRGAPLRRMSAAPSHRHARVRTPSPTPFTLERCCRSPRYNSRRGSASEESTYSSCYSDDLDELDDDQEDDGVIWFGRRSPPCSHRTEQFRHWVEDAEPPSVSITETIRVKHEHELDLATTLPSSSPRSGQALWSKLFVLWRVRRRVRDVAKMSPSPSHAPSSLASHRYIPSLKSKHASLHRRMATSPS